jgi:hypothetical protein
LNYTGFPYDSPRKIGLFLRHGRHNQLGHEEQTEGLVVVIDAQGNQGTSSMKAGGAKKPATRRKDDCTRALGVLDGAAAGRADATRRAIDGLDIGSAGVPAYPFGSLTRVDARAREDYDRRREGEHSAAAIAPFSQARPI